MQARPKGEGHWNARLTPKDVRAIRAEHAQLIADLMARYGLSKAHLHRVLAGKAWAHLAEGAAS